MFFIINLPSFFIFRYTINKMQIRSHFSTKNERIMSVFSLQRALHEASGIKVGGKIPFDPNIIISFNLKYENLSCLKNTIQIQLRQLSSP